jgi:type IV pilus assembly protein PilV
MQHSRTQSGFTMVEVLVALVVLAIGLLGIAALYLNSLQAGRTAIYRTEAVTLASDLADPIRMNRTAEAAYNATYGTATTAVGACATTAGCTDAQLATTDLADWKAAIAQRLPDGEGEVTVTAPTGVGEPATYVVSIRWSEVGEAAKISFQLGFQT